MGISFFRRTKAVDAPVPGAVYQRVIFNTVETAQVLSVTQDGFPLPHVRYVSRNTLLDGPEARGPHRHRANVRTLSVESFTRLFGAPCAS